MATEVIQGNEIILNSVRYPVIGKVQRILTSKLPEKQVFGDYEQDSDPYSSSWGIAGDLRGGIGVEELIEGKDDNRCWWSELILEHRNQLTLPPLCSSATLPAADSAGYTSPTGASGWGTSANVYDDNTATSASVTIAASSASATLTITRTAVMSCDKARFHVSTSTGLSWVMSAYYESAWHVMTGTVSNNDWADFTISDTYAVTQLKVVVTNASTGSLIAFVNEVDFYDHAPAIGSPTRWSWANYNSTLYVGLGAYLCALNVGGTGFTVVKRFPHAIQSLIPSLNSKLYIFLGDDHKYWHMNTAGTCTESDSSDAQLGIQWDAKLWKISTDGTFARSTDPDGASPTWTAGGTMSDVASGDIKNLFIGKDSDGEDIIYASTRKGLKAYDSTNARWLDTELTLPDHTNGGNGALSWRSDIYISCGLEIAKYTPGSTAQVTTIGLDKDDGIIKEHNGEIMSLIGAGHTDLYALIDASQTSGTSKSSVMKYDDYGWQVFWAEQSTSDGAMNGGIVSSDSAYRLWFDHNAGIYYIPLYQGINNPHQLASTFTYASAGIHISSWFDGGWHKGSKRANKLQLYCSGSSTVETIAMKYRIDHSNIDKDTSWTTLGSTITSNGLTTTTFASGAGLVFKSIQFRFDLARGSTTTKSPNIQWATLEYTKVIPKRWGWQFTVDCSKGWHGKSSKQLIDALITAAELETKPTFIFDNSTKYVEIVDVSGERETGKERFGQFTLLVTEV